MRASSLSVLVLCVWSVASAHAEPRPSFYLEPSAWFATHVIVATEGEEIDGALTVLESWKGDLQPGDSITVPKLADITSLETSRSFFELTDTPRKTRVTGERMLLFLKRLPDGWEGANYGDLKVSIVWFEGDESFAFFQEVNPGDAALVHNQSEADIRRNFATVESTRERFDRAARIEDAARRAEALAPFATSEVFVARLSAFDELRQCGTAALPALVKLLRDETKLEIHAEVVDILASAGAPEATRELLGIVRDGVTFWTRTAPKLNEGW